MKVYVATDMEGASGVTQERMTFAHQPRYQEGRRALTLDVNAAVRGARAGGAEQVVVADGHGASQAYNFIFEELEAGGTYIMGNPRHERVLDDSFNLMFCVAYHGMAGADCAVLDHTQSSRAIVQIRLNDLVVGELGMTAATAGHFGVAVGLVTGDEATCAEARELLGEKVLVAPVKRGLSRTSALCMAPADARALIQEKAQQAVQRADQFDPWTIAEPVTLRVQYLRTEQADGWRSAVGDRVRMLDPRTVEIDCDNAFHAVQAYRTRRV
jgi:D-amino peptidase